MSNIDPLLASYLRLVTEHNAGIDVTITANGAVLTGVLVSEDEWLKGLQEEIKRTFNLSDEDTNDDGTTEQDEESEEEPEIFLHLKDGLPLAGGMHIHPNASGGWWRIRARDVSAWCLGKTTSAR